ncbi:MAG: ParA family protein [Candidatus Omnitrophota bacterium]|jgi:chromosome partitioning protein|nr:MAG: ParA family protein [Candidatus Omnitrophota bacterium]
MRIISVTNQKGGCGKTTSSINLAASLAANNKKVLLIDLDPQAHATFGLSVKADLNIYNVLSKMTHRKAKLGDIINKIDDNFDLAPSSIVLSTLEQELASEIGRESRLLDTLNNFRADYDYVLIDCPPNLGILTINAMRAANEVIIPVEASRFALEGVSQLVEIINLIRDRLGHSIDYHVLVTNFDSRLRHSFMLLDKIRITFKDKLFSTMIHVNVKLKEAQNSGAHILKYDKYCRGAKDYYSLSREVILQERTPGTFTPVLEKRMKEILKKELPKLTEVVFAFSAPEAKNVYIAGDFNGWATDEKARMQLNDGKWTKRVSLKPGSYHYRFVVDGKWVEDFNNPLREENPYGEMDSIVKIA